MILLGRIKVARIDQELMEENQQLRDLGLDISDNHPIEAWSPILIDLNNVATMFPSSTMINGEEVPGLDITLVGAGFHESILVLVGDVNTVMDTWIEEKGLVKGSLVDEY